MGEIGSEFFIGSSQKGINKYISLIDYSKRYVLSGRTGLYLIASELKTKNISSIALPAYCCGSMVAPFVDAGFKITFYEENIIQESESILIMDYFGFLKNETAEFAKNAMKQVKRLLLMLHKLLLVGQILIDMQILL